MAGNRVIVTLSCSGCKNKNYYFTHGTKRQYKIAVQKFCPACKKHTPHKESK